MTNHKGMHRPPRRLFRPRVAAVAVLLIVGSAVGLYFAHAAGPSVNTALTARTSRHSTPKHKDWHSHNRPGHDRAATTPTQTSGHGSATPAPTPTATVTSTPPPVANSTPVPAGSSSTPTASTTCSGAANTPGGPDPWGGCWPGPGNTGVPAGISLAAYNGPCTISVPNTVIDAKLVNCALDIEAPGVTIQDSKINGQVHNNSSGSLLIEDTEINGGNDQSESVGGDNITILGSNLYGDQHEFHCGSNCTLENSWLHDNYNFGSSGHQNGFLSNGGSNFLVQHNSVYCVGGCTGDITFIPDGDISKATVNKNLLMTTQYAAFCLYPSSDHPSKPGVVTGMVVTDNVFQRGANGTCAYYGPVYGWDVSNTPGVDGYGNVWSGNTWNNGQSLDHP